ncbi:hypothetical protein ACROYT_G033976 [Oculina patagonica]
MVYNAVCQFSCNYGYIWSGSQVRRCKHNGHWSGQNFTCQIDSCTSSPCYNNGSCTWLPGGFNCTCLPEFYGENCETFDNCTSSPCLNNGTCTRYPGGYNCTCRPDFYGDNCETFDNCTSSPCLNNGTCTRYPGGYNCTCRPDFYGDNCEIFDNCTSSPCLNNGTCTRYPGGYNCTCRPEFYGDNCENISSTAIATTRTEGSKQKRDQKSAIIAGACVGGVLFVVINSFGLVYAYKNRDRFFNRSSKKLTDDPKSYNNDAYVANDSNITSGEQATDVENFEFYTL